MRDTHPSRKSLPLSTFLRLAWRHPYAASWAPLSAGLFVPLAFFVSMILCLRAAGAGLEPLTLPLRHALDLASLFSGATPRGPLVAGSSALFAAAAFAGPFFAWRGARAGGGALFAAFALPGTRLQRALKCALLPFVLPIHCLAASLVLDIPPAMALGSRSTRPGAHLASQAFWICSAWCVGVAAFLAQAAIPFLTLAFASLVEPCFALRLGYDALRGAPTLDWNAEAFDLVAGHALLLLGAFLGGAGGQIAQAWDQARDAETSRSSTSLLASALAAGAACAHAAAGAVAAIASMPSKARDARARAEAALLSGAERSGAMARIERAALAPSAGPASASKPTPRL